MAGASRSLACPASASGCATARTSADPCSGSLRQRGAPSLVTYGAAISIAVRESSWTRERSGLGTGLAASGGRLRGPSRRYALTPGESDLGVAVRRGRGELREDVPVLDDLAVGVEAEDVDDLAAEWSER